MTPEQTVLVERVRAMLPHDAVVREVSMFGGRAVMVDERMLVSVHKDGRLLVRIDADRHDSLLREPGARQAEMGKGRSMGPGWIDVDSAAVSTDVRLRVWVEVALEYHGRDR